MIRIQLFSEGRPTRTEITFLIMYDPSHRWAVNDIQWRLLYMDEWSECTLRQIASMDESILLDDYNWVTYPRGIPRSEWPLIKKAILEERPGECTMFQTRAYTIEIVSWGIRIFRGDQSAFVGVRPLDKETVEQTMPLVARFWREQDEIDSIEQESLKDTLVRRHHLIALLE
jgi:hypothetical protein